MARRLGRRDGDDTPRRNDWALSTTILLMSLGKISGDLLEVISKGVDPQKTAHIAYWLLGLVIVTFVSVDRDRYASWVVEGDRPTRLKRIWGGIVLPDAVALAIFSLYQYLKVTKKL